MYSTYYDNLRHTLNTYLRRPIKKLFRSQTKKCVINVNKNTDNTVETAYPKYAREEDWFEESEAILSFGVSEMFEK